MKPLFDNLTSDQADTCGLVLSSSGIAYRAVPGVKGWEIWVAEEQMESALVCLQQYFKENQAHPSVSVDSGRPYHKTASGILAAGVLGVCHLLSLTSARQDIIHAYGASAELILNGEFFRTVTALMLHADGIHLAGNILGMALFGTAVGGSVGWGCGWLMILCAGMIGNFLNAVLIQSGHVSIGASTAIFGAVGILSAHQFFRQFRMPERRMRAWLPLAGGIALLALLGAGPHTDITAHLFGFASGVIFGLGYGKFGPAQISRKNQLYCATIFWSVLILSWITAFSHT